MSDEDDKGGSKPAPDVVLDTCCLVNLAAIDGTLDWGWKLATDDRKARIKAEAVGVAVVTTPELLQRWASQTGRSPVEVANALRRIETLARFAPSADSPAARWWRKIVDENPTGGGVPILLWSLIL